MTPTRSSQSWGVETPKKFTEEEIAQCPQPHWRIGETYGIMLRAKGIVADGETAHWIHFDYVPGEIDIRTGSAGVTGRLCVIGSKLNEAAIRSSCSGLRKAGAYMAIPVYVFTGFLDSGKTRFIQEHAGG